jgi:hypothetical protein
MGIFTYGSALELLFLVVVGGKQMKNSVDVYFA